MTGIAVEVAWAELGRIGIKVPRSDGAAPCFIVANRSPAIEQILEGTPWAHGWMRPLRSLPGAAAAHPTYFHIGLNERGTAIPIALLGSEDNPINNAETMLLEK